MKKKITRAMKTFMARTKMIQLLGSSIVVCTAIFSLPLSVM